MVTSSVKAPAVNINLKKRRRRRRRKMKSNNGHIVQNMDQKYKHTDDFESGKSGAVAEDCSQDSLMQVDSAIKLSQEHPKADTVLTEDKKDEHMDDFGRGKNGGVAEDCSQDSLMQVDSAIKLPQEHPKADTVPTTNTLENCAKPKKKRKKRAKKKAESKNGPQNLDHTASSPSIFNISSDNVCSQLSQRADFDLEIQNREVRAHRSSEVMNTTTSKPEVMNTTTTTPEVMNEVMNTATTTTPEVMNVAQNCLLAERYQIPQRRPFTSPRRKLLILDVNGLLADIVNPPPLDQRANTNISGRAIFKRPFYYDFLKFCFERFDVGIWSSRSKWIIDRVVDYLLGNLKHKLLFCWDMFHCTQTSFKTLENRHKPLVLKELRKLWEKHDPNLPWEKGDYDESNTLLVDDSPYKALRNPMHTGVFPYSYRYKTTSDNSLGRGGDLRVYLEGLATAENVQNYVAQHPFGQGHILETHLQWSFYSEVLKSFGLQSGKE